MPKPANTDFALLRTHHARVLTRIDVMQVLTSSTIPDVAALAVARLELSRASSDRTDFIVRTIYPLLISRPSSDLLDGLSTLSQQQLAHSDASSEHVARWSEKAIRADWGGYRKDFRVLSMMMRERVTHEIAVLYEHLQGSLPSSGSELGARGDRKMQR